MDDESKLPLNVSVKQAPVGGLVKKLCLVMGELKNLPKNGWNDFHKYSYVKESDVVNGLRDLLAKHSVFVFHNVKEQGHKEVKGRDGKASYVATVHIEYTFVDGETGQERTVNAYGCGHDTMEKGLYKALAGAHKYFLMKSFNLSEGTEDDPENESKGTSQGGRAQANNNQHRQTRQGNSNVQRRQENPTGPRQNNHGANQGPANNAGEFPNGINQNYLRRIFALAGPAGWQEADINEYVEKTYKIKSKKLLNPQQAKALSEYIISNPIKRAFNQPASQNANGAMEPAPTEDELNQAPFTEDDGPFPFEDEYNGPA